MFEKQHLFGCCLFGHHVFVICSEKHCLHACVSHVNMSRSVFWTCVLVTCLWPAAVHIPVMCSVSCWWPVLSCIWSSPVQTHLQHALSLALLSCAASSGVCADVPSHFGLTWVRSCLPTCFESLRVKTRFVLWSVMCCKCGHSPVCDVLKHMLRHRLLSCVRMLCVIAVGLSHVRSCVWLHFIMWLQLVPACFIMTYHHSVCHVQLHVSHVFMIRWHAAMCSVTCLWWLGHIFSYHLLQAHGLDMWFMCVLEVGSLLSCHTFWKQGQPCIWSHVCSDVHCMVTCSGTCSVTLGQVCHMLVMCLNTFSVTCLVRY